MATTTNSLQIPLLRAQELPRHRNGNVEASAFNNFNSSFCFNVSKKEANIGNESKQAETSQSNLELWTEFETAFLDPADSNC